MFGSGVFEVDFLFADRIKFVSILFYLIAESIGRSFSSFSFGSSRSGGPSHYEGGEEVGRVGWMRKVV